MKKKSHPPKLNKQKLAQIWQIGSNLNEDVEMSQDEVKTEQLKEYLAASLHLDADTAKILPNGLRKLCQEMRPFTGMTIGNLLLDEGTDIETIGLIKERCKKQNRATATEAEQATTTALYYAAIAHALAYHQRKITEFTYKELNDSFGSFLATGWLTEELRVLFKRAQGCCTSHIEQEGQ